MRQIKFRAWDSKKMRYDYVPRRIINQYSQSPSYYDNEMGLTTPYVMQFTGLLDKNGKEIYEGDILGRTTDKNFVFVVDFANGEFSGVTEPGRNHRLSLSEAMTLDRSPYVEVIGNIYEQPDLLTTPSGG